MPKPLPLPAGKFVRIAKHIIRVETDFFEQIGDAFFLLGFIADAVNFQRLGND
jgi:hypothetical protein